MTPFLAEYVELMGRSKVPPEFHWWAAMSLLAAVAGDRLWVEHAGRRLRPNLYVLLLGPSGAGKGTAIQAAAELGREILAEDLFYGRTTPEGLRDRLRQPRPRPDGTVRPSNPRIWLLMEELAFCIGQERGTEFVSTLVATYGGSPVPIRDRTRTGGEIVIPGNVCVNFLAGTTKEWLQRTLTSDDLAGGFSRRLVVVAGARPEERLSEPIFPDDRAARLLQLQERLAILALQEGRVEVTRDARDTFDEWYMGRPGFDDDPGLLPWWDTQDELVYKVALILALSDGPPLQITRLHMEYAQAMTNQLKKWVAEAIVYSATTPEAKKLAYVRSIIRAAGMLTRRALQQRCSPQGVLKFELDRYLGTLIETGEVRTFPGGPQGGQWYQWIGTDRSVPPDLRIVEEPR